jgi:hypothetical protein
MQNWPYHYAVAGGGGQNPQLCGKPDAYMHSPSISWDTTFIDRVHFMRISKHRKFLFVNLAGEILLLRRNLLSLQRQFRRKLGSNKCQRQSENIKCYYGSTLVQCCYFSLAEKTA